MDQLIRLNKKQIKNHILIWTIIFTFFNLYLRGPWVARIIGGILDAINCTFVFYSVSLFIYPKYWVNKRIYSFVISILISCCLYVAIANINFLHIMPYLGRISVFHNMPIARLTEDLFYYFVFGSAGIAYYYYNYSIHNFKLLAEREKLLLIKELNFIKNQFNSHITFNFLNYCYSKVHRKQPKTAESIGLFSDMLRYTMQTKPDEKVAISEEITNIQNFINLQKMLSANVYATFTSGGETGERFILSRILFVFVDNAFKYGVFNNPQFPITINLEVNNNKLLFSVNNKVNTNKKQVSTHTGLDNVIQMLNLYYANNYDLIIEEREGFYSVKLFLNVAPENEVPAPSKQYRQVTGKPSVTTPKCPSGESGTGIRSLMTLNKNQIKIHILGWVLFITYMSISRAFYGTWAAKIIGYGLITLDYMFIFYSLSLFIFPKFWERKRILLLIGIIVTLLLYWVIMCIIFFKIILALGGPNYYEKKTLYFFLSSKLYYFVFIGTAGVASFFSRYGLYKLKQQAEKEKLLLVKELNYLKEQFNSHLTFNFLNYCYSNIYKYSTETAESIRIFADMLRYTLQTGVEEVVALSKEIIYIENFISIQKLLSTKVYTEFSYQGETGDKKILPRILVTFVENAFKHGVLNDPQFPITINLMVEDNQLAFIVKNKINRSKRIESTNKGMENVSQILDLYYANNYELKKEENGEFYNVELRMGLREEPQSALESKKRIVKKAGHVEIA